MRFTSLIAVCAMLTVALAQNLDIPTNEVSSSNNEDGQILNVGQTDAQAGDEEYGPVNAFPVQGPVNADEKPVEILTSDQVQKVLNGVKTDQDGIASEESKLKKIAKSIAARKERIRKGMSQFAEWSKTQYANMKASLSAFYEGTKKHAKTAGSCMGGACAAAPRTLYNGVKAAPACVGAFCHRVGNAAAYPYRKYQSYRASRQTQPTQFAPSVADEPTFSGEPTSAVQSTEYNN